MICRIGQAVTPMLGREPTFALLKGRHHYLCMAKLEHSDEEDPADTLFDTGGGGKVQWLGEAGRIGKAIARIRDWAMESDTGDRDELDPGVDDSTWRMVSTPARVRGCGPLPVRSGVLRRAVAGAGPRGRRRGHQPLPALDRHAGRAAYRAAAPVVDHR